jgi:hypothetical protein
MRRLVLPLVACALAFVPMPHDLVERLYARGWYPHLQPLLTRASNAVPFAWLDPFILVLAAAVLIGSGRIWRRTAGARWRRTATVILFLVQFASAVYILLLIVWGFNYRRAPTVERLQISPARITPERLALVGTLATGRVNALYGSARSNAPITADALITIMSPAFARAEESLGSTWHVTPGRPKVSLTARTFPLSGVDGMVNPFALEVILNPEVLPFERPVILAHEWAHLAGHAPESEAGFVALLACLQGPPDAQYSGWLDLLLHVAGVLPAPVGRRMLAALGEGPREDVRAIDARTRRIVPVVRQVSWSVYDEYLRANRVPSGIANYEEMVTLVLGSRIIAPLIDR